mmetsp:Transcript_14785/g.38470  ORF Transcript_14785/g.38470 Transcript_14785/m.38470 type:complete len:534 (+) Transcript_14785:145-1746(+)
MNSARAAVLIHGRWPLSDLPHQLAPAVSAPCRRLRSPPDSTQPALHKATRLLGGSPRMLELPRHEGRRRLTDRGTFLHSELNEVIAVDDWCEVPRVLEALGGDEGGEARERAERAHSGRVRAPLVHLLDRRPHGQRRQRANKGKEKAFAPVLSGAPNHQPGRAPPRGGPRVDSARLVRLVRGRERLGDLGELVRVRVHPQDRGHVVRGHTSKANAHDTLGKARGTAPRCRVPRRVRGARGRQGVVGLYARGGGVRGPGDGERRAVQRREQRSHPQPPPPLLVGVKGAHHLMERRRRGAVGRAAGERRVGASVRAQLAEGLRGHVAPVEAQHVRLAQHGMQRLERAGGHSERACQLVRARGAQRRAAAVCERCGRSAALARRRLRSRRRALVRHAHARQQDGLVQPQLVDKAEGAHGRRAAGSNHRVQLAKNSLSRDLRAELRLHRGRVHRAAQLGVDGVVEARREADRAEHAQRVVQQRLERSKRCVHDPGLQVVKRTARHVLNTVRLQVVEERVDREVAAERVARGRAEAHV